MPAVEELHLLNGELWIDERKLFPGDYNRAEPGSVRRSRMERDRLRLRAGHEHPGHPHVSELPHYPDRERLVEALVPYFIAGLRNNERCLWVAAPPDASWQVVSRAPV